MEIKLGCCVGIDYYDLVHEAGYDTITLPGRDIVAMDKAAFQNLVEKVTNGPLETQGFNAFSYPSLRLNGADFSLSAVSDYAARLLDRGAALGIHYVGIGSPLSRNVRPGEVYQESLAQFKTSIAEVCSIAHTHSIDVLIEAVASIEGNFLNTVREAIAVVDEMSLPNLHLVYDIYHEHMEQQPLETVFEAGKRIKTVHLAQNINARRHYLDREPKHVAEYRSYIQALSNMHYAGEVCIECMEGDAILGIVKSFHILKDILNELEGTNNESSLS